MAGAQNIVVGAAVFTALGILACIGIGIKICKDYEGRLRKANINVMLVSVMITVFSCWLMWASVYLHQLNPIGYPLLDVKKPNE